MSRRAGRLVDDLLTLTRLDAGMELPRAPADLLAARLRQVLAGTPVDVPVEPGRAVVHDDGPGIAAADRGRASDRLGGARSARARGGYAERLTVARHPDPGRGGCRTPSTACLAAPPAGPRPL